MTRRIPVIMLTTTLTLLAILIAGLVALTACQPTAGTPNPPAEPTPTVPRVPPTTVVRKPPAPLPKSHTGLESTTVLLLGIDRRNPDSDAMNTDTLMLFHLNPDARHIAILSIPRDLYVEIPGYGEERVNVAYAWGEQTSTGGLALARQTISSTLGVPVQHAALIDFEAFVTCIDLIGGVDVDVPYDISDPLYPDSTDGYDPFYLPAGQHHLDGETALKYARTRATAGGDFDRTARQRQLVMAVRDRIMQFDLLPELISQSPQLWATIQSAVETDLTLGKVVDLAVAASRVSTEQIVTAGIDQTYTRFYTTPEGAEVLLPDQAAIQALAADLFTSPTSSAAAQ